MTTFERRLEWPFYVGLTVPINLHSDIFILFEWKKSLTDNCEPEFCYDWFHRQFQKPTNVRDRSFCGNS